MVDKQVIINGCDVAGCEYLGLYKECKLKCGSCCPVDCSDNPNCHYKLYKRKEQECERLRFPMPDTNYAILTKEEFEQLDQLKTENEELKKKLKPKLKNAHCVYFDGQTGWCKAKEFTRCNPIGCKLYIIDELSTIVDLQQQLDQLKVENDKFKQTLYEIKELIEQGVKIHDDIIISKQILQVISEVK